MRRIAVIVAILALTVTAGAQVPKSNRLGVNRIAGQKTETTGNVTHFMGQAAVWFERGVRIAADEAFVNMTTSEIEFRGTVKMTVASQFRVTEPSIMLSQDRTGGMNVLLPVKQETFYLGDPAVSVPAEPIAGTILTASRFAIRAWLEGSGVKVVVYAVVPNEKALTQALEVPIATHVLSARVSSVRVTETSSWGASPIVVRMVRPLR